jgi:hypothetical protein
VSCVVGRRDHLQHIVNVQNQEKVPVVFDRLSFRQTLCASGLAKEPPDYLDVARHSDLRVALQRFSEQRLRLFAISWCGAID